MFVLILKQTISHFFRKGGGAFGVLAFYIIVITLFAFALTPQGLHQYATAIMCVGLLLASVTAIPMLFEQDHEDGTLEQFLLMPVALEWLVAAKLAGQYIALILPILLLSPVITIMAGLDMTAATDAMVRLALVSPTILAIGSIAASLTLSSKRGGLLQALIFLPLTIPPLIFATSSEGQEATMFLAGAAMVTLPIACWLSAVLIRLNQD
ncbi:MAG: heme exporter protein CcmB [Alphaproteobacteria bacterium]